MKYLFAVLSLFIDLLLFGQEPSAVPTYECSGIYWKIPENGTCIAWGKHPYEFGERKVEITDPVKWIRNPLIDSGALIPGFNEDFSGSAPDLGAFEVGNPPLQFGRRAYLKYDEGRCPWE